MCGEVLYVRFVTWFHYMLNLLKPWPIDIVDIEIAW